MVYCFEGQVFNVEELLVTNKDLKQRVCPAGSNPPLVAKKEKGAAKVPAEPYRVPR